MISGDSGSCIKAVSGLSVAKMTYQDSKLRHLNRRVTWKVGGKHI